MMAFQESLGLLVDMKMEMLVFHLTVAGSNLLQGDYDGWIKSGKREYDRNDSVIHDYRAGEVTAMATHDEDS